MNVVEMWTFRKITNSHENKTELLHPGAKSEASEKKKSNNVHQQKRSPKTSSEICQVLVYKGMYINYKPYPFNNLFQKRMFRSSRNPRCKVTTLQIGLHRVGRHGHSVRESGARLDSKNLTASIQWKWLIFWYFLNDLIGNQQDPIWRLWVYDSGNFHGIFKFHVEFQWSVPLQIYRERSGKDYDVAGEVVLYCYDLLRFRCCS